MKLFPEREKKRSALKIIIVGAGNVGQALVERLSKEGNDITLVDKDEYKVSEISGMYDVLGIVGNGATVAVQKEAGIDNADLFIAVTDSDELNLLCCTVAKRSGHCAAISRVRSPEYSEEVDYLRNRLGLHLVINPDLEMARETARLFYLPDALEINAFAHDQAELIKFRVPEGNVLDGTKISDFAKTDNAKILICAVERNGEVQIPNGDFVIQRGDKVSFVIPMKHSRDILKLIGFNQSAIKSTLIVGGGRSSYYLAKILLSTGIEVTIIESNRERCEKLTSLLPGAVIINGDGTNEELLKEEGLLSVDSFVALTNIDEQNIFLTLHARMVSDAKVITKIKRTNFKDVIGTLDLGSVVYPRYITAEKIIAYARAKRASLNSEIESLYHMYDNRVEAIEFLAKNKSKVTDVKIKDLRLKKGLMLSFINRNGKIILPTGDDEIKVGDTVMVVTTNTGFNSILDILE